MPRRRNYYKTYWSQPNCSHKRHCLCENETVPDVCTVFSPSLFTHRTYVKGNDGNAPVLILNSTANVFNITDIAYTTDVLSLYLQRDVATNTLLYGTIKEFTTTGIPGIYDPNLQGSEVTTEGYYPTGLPPLNNGMESADTIKLNFNRPTSTGLWPPNFSITFNFIYEEYTKPNCTVSHPVTFFFVNENPITTRSELRVGTQTFGSIPSGSSSPYNLTYNATLKATTSSSPSISWVTDKSPGVNIQTVFAQSQVDPKFTPTFQGDSATISFTGIDTEDAEFTFDEIATLGDGTLVGTKKFIVIVQPPDPFRAQYIAYGGGPNIYPTPNNDGEGSYIYRKANTGPIHWVQGSNLTVNPIAWFPFQRINATTYTPRLQIDDSLILQSSYNIPQNVTGVAVAPNGVTIPLVWVNSNNAGFTAGSLIIGANAAQKDVFYQNFPLGKSVIGFKITNIPVFNGNRDSGITFRSYGVFTNINGLSLTYITATAQSRFVSNSTGATIANLFVATSNNDYVAESLKVKDSNRGISVFSIPKTAYLPSVIVEFQATVGSVDGDGTVTVLEGSKRGKNDYTYARLDQYEFSGQDAVNYFYSFRDVNEIEGYVKGFQWLNNI